MEMHACTARAGDLEKCWYCRTILLFFPREKGTQMMSKLLHIDVIARRRGVHPRGAVPERVAR